MFSQSLCLQGEDCLYAGIISVKECFSGRFFDLFHYRPKLVAYVIQCQVMHQTDPDLLAKIAEGRFVVAMGPLYELEQQIAYQSNKDL